MVTFLRFLNPVQIFLQISVLGKRSAIAVSYTHLDVYKRQIVDLLKLSNRNLNQTILLITHDEKIALETDRIVTIEDGRILSDQIRG